MSSLADLEKRLKHIEDERAVERLIASYGPLVDAGEADATAELWALDGSYDVEGWHDARPRRRRGDGAIRRAPGSDPPWLLPFPRSGGGERGRR